MCIKRGDVLHLVTYLIKMASNWFVTEEAFKEQADVQREANRIHTWEELAEGVIFAIIRIKQVHSSKFNKLCYILHLTDREENKIRVWSPSKLITDLEKKKPTDRPFIVSLGQAKYKKKTFNQFDLVLQEAGEEIKLFDDSDEVEE